jgi:DNA polymerase-3 subunit epsilon
VPSPAAGGRVPSPAAGGRVPSPAAGGQVGPAAPAAEATLALDGQPPAPGAALPPAELCYPLPALPQPLGDLEFVIVDVETTGWLPDEAGITEIGAVRVGGGRVRAEFCTLVNPGGAVPADIAALTGITDAMVAGAPPAATALPRFLAFARGCVLTAHNAAFDVGFLSAACASSGLPWPAFPVLDTVTLARLVLGEAEVPDCKLRTLAEFFGAQTLPCHRALPDAMATAEVLLALLRRLAAAGVRTLAELSAA